jgi:hypothetical protein
MYKKLSAYTASHRVFIYADIETEIYYLFNTFKTSEAVKKSFFFALSRRLRSARCIFGSLFRLGVVLRLKYKFVRPEGVLNNPVIQSLVQSLEYVAMFKKYVRLPSPSWTE